jgi:hypothetical protein
VTAKPKKEMAVNPLDMTAQQRILRVLTRAEQVTDSLPADARPHAERIVSVARSLAARARTETDTLLPQVGDAELRKELAQLVEWCGRRGAWSIPFATLGRALLADLSNDRRSFVSTCEDCEGKLAVLGF